MHNHSFCVSSHKTCSTMALHYKCPHCLSVIKQRRYLLLHFNSNPMCPYRDPDQCLVESPRLGLVRPPHIPPQVRPSSPRQSSNDEQCFTPQDYDDSFSQSSSVETEDDLFRFAVEGDPDFPLLASNLSLQDDSDLTDSSEDESY